MTKEDPFGAECKVRFEHYAYQYRVAKYHSMKRTTVEKIDFILDVYLDWVDIEAQ